MVIDLPAIREELQTKMAELEHRINAVDEHLRTPGSPDSEENAVVHEDDEVLNKIGDATLKELRDVRTALKQIESGNYGSCTACGKKIAVKRLKALPYATTCIGCANNQ